MIGRGMSSYCSCAPLQEVMERRKQEKMLLQQISREKETCWGLYLIRNNNIIILLLISHENAFCQEEDRASGTDLTYHHWQVVEYTCTEKKKLNC